MHVIPGELPGLHRHAQAEAQEAMTFHVEAKPSLAVNDAFDVLVKLWLQRTEREREEKK